MPKFIALCGVSGVGKTHRRTTDPALKNLPFVDIADIYRDNPGIQPRQAFSMLINKAFTMVRDGAETVVLEAYFKPGSFQRESLEYFCEADGVQIEYIELTASIEECKQRIQSQAQQAIAGGEDPAWWKYYTTTRLDLLSR
jgi:predicted kinase